MKSNTQAYAEYMACMAYVAYETAEYEQLNIVRVDGWAIQAMEKPSEAVQLAAVNQDARSIQFIKNPCEAACLAAVSANGYTINYIKKPSAAVKMAAIEANCYAIGVMKKPSIALQLAAVEMDGRVIELIKNPAQQAIKSALTNQRFIDRLEEYEDTVQRLFKDNVILTKKWLRYGDLMRTVE